MAFGLVACQAEKVDVDGGLEGEGSEASYLSVNIIAADATTRAGEGGNNAENDDNYQDGWEKGDADPNESKVDKIRFYFFYNGVSTSVNLVTGYSYCDFDVTSDGFGNNGNGLPNVEHKLNATVVLHRTYQNGASPDGLPNQVIAIINPTEEIASYLGSNPSLEKVQTAPLNALGITDGSFVMTNSVYVDKVSGTATKIDAVPITKENYKDTEEEAIKNPYPVKIYVERVVAKLDLSIKKTLSNSENVNDYWDPDTKQQPKMQEEQLNNGEYAYNTWVKYDGENYAYVQLKGWNVTATADKSFLVKNVNPEWDGAVDDILEATNLFKTANEPWNFASFYRSYWAYNPNDVKLQYGTFNATSNETPKNSGSMTDNNPAQKNQFSTTNICYLPENAGKSSADAANDSPTQVIIAAQLVDADGEALKYAEFMGEKFIYDDGYNNVKSYILNALMNTTKYYKKVENKFVSMGPADVEIKSALEMDNTLLDKSKVGRYYVYAQLTSMNETWYTYKGADPAPETASENDFTAINKDDKTGVEVINEALALLPAKIWKDGNTYYFLNIRHLANPAVEANQNNTTPGWFGVVRNHVYKTGITGIFGLGTPVFNPDEIIIPEIPEEDEIYLAAEINILSWRIVDHGYDLVW